LMMVRSAPLKFTFAFRDLLMLSFAFAMILSLKTKGRMMAAAMRRSSKIPKTRKIFFSINKIVIAKLTEGCLNELLRGHTLSNFKEAALSIIQITSPFTALISCAGDSCG